MSIKHDVILVGEVCCDLIFNDIPSMPKLGEEIWAKQIQLTAGGMMNTAAAISRLGLKAALVAETGSDVWGDLIVSKMKEEGIDIRYNLKHDDPYPQITVALNYRNDRAFVSYAEKTKKDKYLEHGFEVIRNSDSRIYHFSANKDYIGLIKEAKKLNKKVSLDVSWEEEWLQSPQLKQVIGMADFFLPNLKEAQMITGRTDPYEALEVLAAMVPVAVIKIGDQGSICKTDGNIYSTAAFEANVVDSTGAGDCFVAGFLYGWLKERSVGDCLRIASYCGGKCVESVGGYSGVPNERQLKQDLLLSMM